MCSCVGHAVMHFPADHLPCPDFSYRVEVYLKFVDIEDAHKYFEVPHRLIDVLRSEFSCTTVRRCMVGKFP